MSTLCATALAGSQYALLTSLVAFPGSFLASLSGFAVAWLGFAPFFVATSLSRRAGGGALPLAVAPRCAHRRGPRGEYETVRFVIGWKG